MAIQNSDIPGVAAVILGLVAFVQWQMSTLFSALSRIGDPGAVTNPGEKQSLKKQRFPLKVKLFCCTLFEVWFLLLLISLWWYWNGTLSQAYATAFPWLFSWSLTLGGCVYVLVLLSTAWMKVAKTVVFAVLAVILVTLAFLPWEWLKSLVAE